MFLKSLTLKGFKSFADTTTLELEPGVTVVVGPNGSGKSNVVDAVAWVLGAQGPRTVRSAKMDDVIFAGSGKRPALGRAEVSLTIDNSAGLLPIEFTELTITRTLFRSGDSEYAINGAECRLLDIQELLSETGVGRQQHVIVSQGQLASVLDARPEERRLIVEEAAGVVKYRRRRERAQRRLDATEANLVRLTDLLRELRRQLRPLERQADAARRHDGLVAELAALRLHLAGVELAALERALAAAAAQGSGLQQALARAAATAATLDGELVEAEAAISPPGGDELSELLGRMAGQRERARGLAAVVTERRRSLERESRAVVDEAVVASLDADAARLTTELAATETEATGLLPQMDELSTAEAELAAERAASDAAGVLRLPGMGGQAAELRGELSALRRAIDAAGVERCGLADRAAALAAQLTRLDDDMARTGAERLALDERVAASTAALAVAEADRRQAESRAATAAEERTRAEGEQRGWQARSEALALALEQALGGGGHSTATAELAEVAGVVGTLRDLVEVDEGWELAFEAAMGEALAAVVVEGVDAARRALDRLRDGVAGRGGTVLAAGVASPPASLALDAGAAGAEPVRGHVRARSHHVHQLLDGLLAHAVAVDGGWRDALDLALAAPGLVVVTMAGDRFAANWWRAGAPATVATRAALDEARQAAMVADVDAARAGELAAGTAQELATARQAEAGLAAQHRQLDAAARDAGEAERRVQADRVRGAGEADAVRDRITELADRVAREQSRVAEIEERLPEVEADDAVVAEAAVSVELSRARLDERAAALATLRNEVSLRLAGLEERRNVLARRLAEVEHRLRGHSDERARAAERRAGLETAGAALAGIGPVVEAALARLDSRFSILREIRREQQRATQVARERRDGLRRERAVVEAEIDQCQEALRRLELSTTESRLRHEAAVEALGRDLGSDVEAAKAAACPALPDGVAAPEQARRLERELRQMGAINPLALEEHEALQERHGFVEAQLDDVRASRRELGKVIRVVDEELVGQFSQAFADVAAHFELLFATLFPGGSGRLRLTDPENMLETGIDVEACPPGKNVRSLSLLSGGERSLVALAFLFAVFRSRPSPFYLLDEVEAALDDVNLHRFLGLLQEFRNEAQLLVVTHQKRTMEIADCLYGITLQAGGSSKVLSERVASPT